MCVNVYQMFCSESVPFLFFLFERKKKKPVACAAVVVFRFAGITGGLAQGCYVHAVLSCVRITECRKSVLLDGSKKQKINQRPQLLKKKKNKKNNFIR